MKLSKIHERGQLVVNLLGLMIEKGYLPPRVVEHLKEVFLFQTEYQTMDFIVEVVNVTQKCPSGFNKEFYDAIF